jgi:DNA-binding response OmpR family regulator
MQAALPLSRRHVLCQKEAMAHAAPEILIAASDIDQRLLECLADCRAMLVRTFEEAQRALRERWFSMVVIDLNFDNARTFELFQHVCALAERHGAPVLCVQGLVGMLGAPSLRMKEVKPGARRLCALVIQHDVDAAHELAETIEAAGHEVDLAYDAAAGLDAARRLRPDVVFVDSSDRRLAQRLRAEPALRSARLVALARDGGMNDERMREAGFDHSVAMPVDRDSLRALLEAALLASPS